MMAVLMIGLACICSIIITADDYKGRDRAYLTAIACSPLGFTPFILSISDHLNISQIIDSWLSGS